MEVRASLNFSSVPNHMENYVGSFRFDHKKVSVKATYSGTPSQICKSVNEYFLFLYFLATDKNMVQ